MKKVKIKVSAGIKFLSYWKELWTVLPENEHYILNKKICGCGATEAYIRSKKKIILASPRKYLPFNKYSQHLSDNLHLYRYQGDKKKYFESKNCSEKDILSFNDELEKYINSGGSKILTTYDSLRKVFEVLKKLGVNIDEWIVVVDECQSIFYDCVYKATTEYEFGEILKAFSTVVYLSATPFLESYLDMLEQFRDLTVYELVWPEEMVQLPEVEVIKSKKSVLELCSKLIKDYREGNGRTKLVDGKNFVAREAVFYINSVTEIEKIIKKNDLKPDEVTIICSSKSENLKKLEALSKKTGERFRIGDIPGKGETHKMFTFCTSTVYIGADFYSTNAYSYIFANPQLSCMAVDVSIDLQQIIGRQRLEENPFRNSGTLYFNTRSPKVSREELEKLISDKKERSRQQIENYNTAPHKEVLLKTMENAFRSRGHKEDYCCIVKDVENNVQVVENELLEIAERRAWEVVNQIYNSDFSMYRALESGVSVTKASDSENPEVQNIFKEWNRDNRFERKAKLYCNLYDTTPELLEKCVFIERKYKEYHDAFGREGFDALCWREDYIKQVLAPTPFDKLPKEKIAGKLIKALRIGKVYTKLEVKGILVNIYKELGITGKPSASDVSEYLTCEDKTSRVKGKITAGIKVTSHFKNKVSLFGKITDINNPQEYDVVKILDIIEKNTYFNLDKKVDAVRKAGNKNEKDKAKSKLPAVVWNGTFRTKHRNDLIHYSSFTALDFDDIPTDQMSEFGKWLQGFPCVYAYFITPSGKGYKAIILHDNYEPLYHYDLYRQLLEEFKCGLINDSSTIDLARGHYLSYDPNLWRNPDPKPYHFVPSTPEPQAPDMITETVIKGDDGEEMMVEDDSYVTNFLNTLSREVVSDDSIIRILGKIWNGKALEKGRNNTALPYAGILCKAGVAKDRAKLFIEELIPNFDVTEIIEYAYTHNVFGCERRKYKSRKK